jgi:receptor protein-tyrosine kinase
VHDSTADGARRLTDEVVSQFRALVDQLETIESDAAPAARVAVIDQAQTPAAPSGPQGKRILVLGAIAGLVLGLLLAFARQRLDRRLHTSDEVAALLPVPILGIVDEGRPGEAGELRRLRTRLGDDPDVRSVLLAPLSQGSRPEVAIGLARALADTGGRVVLVDADTSGHGSSVHAPHRPAIGLAGLLRRSSPLDNAVTFWDEAGIAVLTMGEIDSRTPDLLDSDRFTEIMDKLRSEFDYVITECAPVTAAADALALARRCDATVGVVELGPATTPQVLGAVATFGPGDPRLTGVVVFSRRRFTLLHRSGGGAHGR